MTTTPLQTALEAQIAEKLRERRLVVWLDADRSYTPFVDSLKDRGFFAPVVAFRGSYLETLLELEPHLDGLEPPLLLVHLPGLNQATVKDTPLFEVYEAGRVHQVALETVLREGAVGVVPQEEVDDFLRGGPTTLEAAEAWLLRARDRDTKGFAAWLDTLPPEWVFDGLVRGELQRRLETPQDEKDLSLYLERHTGFRAEFAQSFPGDLAQGFAAWLMAVEYVFDLKREPFQDLLKPAKRLEPPLRKVCARLVQRLRSDHQDRYRSFAMRAEELLDEDLSAGRPDELGRIDTFAREDSRLLEAALEALAEGRWGQALGWAEERLGQGSLWLECEPERRQEWVLVRSAAWFGRAVDTAREPLKGARDLADALDRYALCAAGDRRTGAQAVDRAHREFESERLRLLSPKLPHFIRLSGLAADLRSRYRRWVDDLTRAFADLCVQEGFLPPRHLQQRALYEEVVHPLTQESAASVALILVDALRFEMACELADHFDRPGYSLALKARYAELPSITAVGMNALAPVARGGSLSLERPFDGFRLGDYVVRSRQARLRAMGERSLERLPQNRRTPVALTLQEVCDQPPDKLRDQVRQAPLTVVTSRELDDAGEASLGLATFEVLLAQLRSAVLHLFNAGIGDVVIASDHGFLLQDETAESLPFGTGLKVDRRYALAQDYQSVPGTRTVPLRDLGYEGAEGHLLLAEDTRTFVSNGKSPGPFVHGGNSLQERVIPVLHLARRQRTSVHVARYRLEAMADQPIAGFSRLRVRVSTVQDPQMLLSFAVAPDLPVALRAMGEPDVRLLIQEAPRATLQNQRLLLKVDQDFTEVLFTLEGEAAARARIEVYHPDEEKVEPFLIPEFFDVRAVPRGTGPGGASLTAERTDDWSSRFEDEKVREVFRHLHAHGNLTEEELIRLLGTPRAATRFSSMLDEYEKHLPFHVRVEVVGFVKRYVRG